MSPTKPPRPGGERAAHCHMVEASLCDLGRDGDVDIDAAKAMAGTV
jgi:hypothetical protein